MSLDLQNAKEAGFNSPQLSLPRSEDLLRRISGELYHWGECPDDIRYIVFEVTRIAEVICTGSQIDRLHAMRELLTLFSVTNVPFCIQSTLLNKVISLMAESYTDCISDYYQPEDTTGSMPNVGDLLKKIMS